MKALGHPKRTEDYKVFNYIKDAKFAGSASCNYLVSSKQRVEWSLALLVSFALVPKGWVSLLTGRFVLGVREASLLSVGSILPTPFF